MTGRTRLTGRVHERFDVALPSSPTTGYGWVLEGSPPVRLLDRSYQPGGPGLGAQGTEHLGLEPLQVGTFILSLRYRRPWDGDVGDEREIELTVTPTP